jgi:hypothetical protein
MLEILTEPVGALFCCFLIGPIAGANGLHLDAIEATLSSSLPPLSK